MGECGSGALTLATLDFEWGSCHTRLPHVYCVFEWVNSVLQHCNHSKKQTIIWGVIATVDFRSKIRSKIRSKYEQKKS